MTITSGTDRLVSRSADSGKELTYYQCQNVSWGNCRFFKYGLTIRKCGNTMFAVSGKAPDTYFLKVGLIDDDDFLNTLGAPKMEIYCKYLWNWEKTFEGAQVTQN